MNPLKWMPKSVRWRNRLGVMCFFLVMLLIIYLQPYALSFWFGLIRRTNAPISPEGEDAVRVATTAFGVMVVLGGAFWLSAFLVALNCRSLKVRESPSRRYLTWFVVFLVCLFYLFIGYILVAPSVFTIRCKVYAAFESV